jgi:hypothetical protein
MGVPDRSRSLVNSCWQLICATNTIHLVESKESRVIITPQSLNSLSSNALFDDASVQLLAELQAVSRTEDGDESQEADRKEVSISLSPGLLSLYGRVLVEVVRLYESSKYVTIEPSGSRN